MQILYEDSDVLAIAKPAGIAVIPGRDETLEQSLQGRLQEARHERLWVVHRLDRDTSGVVLFARNAAAHRELSMAFERREVSKTYLAWVRGVPPPSGIITTPLHTARKGKMRPALAGEDGSLPSETEYRVLYSAETLLGPVACVEASPRTGRQHQIRVHLRSIDAPLLVDPFYGKCDVIEAGKLGDGSPEVGRLTLHAARIAWGTIGVAGPLPRDLEQLDGWLQFKGKNSVSQHERIVRTP